MIIYLSMIAVIALCAVGNSITGGIMLRGKRFPVRASAIWAYLPMLYIIFWVGIRTQFVDTAAYIKMYADIPADSFKSIVEYTAGCGKDRLFFFLSAVFKKFAGSNYHYWLFAIAFICGLCVVRQLRRHSDGIFLALYLFMTMSIFTWMMNGIRQFIAVSVMFAFSDLMTDRKKRWLYLILVLLLSLIHSSALYALLFIVIVMFSKPWDWKMILLTAAVAAAAANADGFIGFLSETAAKEYAETLNEYGGSNIIRAAVYSVPAALSFAAKKIIKQKDDPYINLCVNMSLVCALLYVLSAFTNGILIGRMPIYFQMYDLILLPWLLKHCFTPRDGRVLASVCVICFFIYFIYDATVAGDYYYASELTGFLGKNIR